MIPLKDPTTHQTPGPVPSSLRLINRAKRLVMRDFAIGMQIYYNYMRPHEALDGKTPAEAVEGENKWMTLIQNAATAAK